MLLPEGSKLMLLAPMVEARKGEHVHILDRLRAQGYIRARIDGTVVSLDEAPELQKNFKHTIEAVVDRVVVQRGQEQRLAESFETAIGLGEGLVRTVVLDDEGRSAQEMVFSARYACPHCGYSLSELEPRLFSFNNPAGACPSATGSACASSSIRNAWSAIPACRCRPEPYAAGTGATPFTSSCWNRWRNTTSSISTSRSRSCRKKYVM